MKCNGCGLEFIRDELDLSGSCYECANYDPDPKPDLIAITVLAARGAFQKLIKSLGRKVSGESN
jgi:hypothetical protein